MTATFSIVVLEDSDEDFETVCDAIPAGPQRVRRAVTGEECLRLLGEELPALLLVDLNTPGMDGRDTIAAVRADARSRNVPIVVLSTSNSTREIAQCYAQGVNAYHVKPLRYPDHLAVVRALFGYWFCSAVLPVREMS